MEFLKIMFLCLAAAFICVFFSQYKKEYAAVIAVAAGAMVLITAFGTLISPLNTLLDILSGAGVNAKYFAVALKTVALGYITQFVAETCRDFGCGSIATKAELAGKISIFLACMPLVNELFTVITELL